VSIDSLPDCEQWLWSDGDLAAASNAGCQDALSEIYRRFYARLVRLCRLRVCDRDLAQDIAQTTILRAIRYLPTFEGDRPLWPWLRMIALRQCATVERKRSAEVNFEEQTDLHEPSDACDKVLLQLTLQTALEDLPVRQRQALQLRYLEDLGHEEAACIIGVNRNAFDQLLARGRHKLAAAFSGDNPLHGLGLVTTLAFLRRAGRRASDATSYAPSASAPLMAASLAAAAGVAAVLTIHIGTSDVTQSPSDKATVVGSANQEPTELTRRSTSVVSGRPRTVGLAAPVAAATPVLATYVAPHPLSSGKVDDQRLVIVTPAGTVDAGGGEDQGNGSATICRALDAVAAAAHCEP
jgi:RNA polymerase sigma-70 factor (ECF subfamily)